jgi:hypothetical protein
MRGIGWIRGVDIGTVSRTAAAAANNRSWADKTDSNGDGNAEGWIQSITRGIHLGYVSLETFTPSETVRVRAASTGRWRTPPEDRWRT